MAAASSHPASLAVPLTQNTAPVVEFRCLFTQDLRRKQKRWQDGRLKYHTFNKRVMVYDERANLIGDTHWRLDYDLDDGEELQLDRGGYLVQVSECVGEEKQDLTELLDKRRKDKEARTTAREAAAQASPRPPSTAAASQQRLKTLSEVLGTPTGRYGRAQVSAASPYEQRLQKASQAVYESPERPAKKPRREPEPKRGYAQNLTGATLSLQKGPTSSAWRSTPIPATQSRWQKPVIDLTRDDEAALETVRVSERIRETHPAQVQDASQKLVPGFSIQQLQTGSRRGPSGDGGTVTGQTASYISQSRMQTAVLDASPTDADTTALGSVRQREKKRSTLETLRQQAENASIAGANAGELAETPNGAARRTRTAANPPSHSDMTSKAPLQPLTYAVDSGASSNESPAAARARPAKLLRAKTKSNRRKLLYLDARAAASVSAVATPSLSDLEPPPPPPPPPPASQITTALEAQNARFAARLERIQRGQDTSRQEQHSRSPISSPSPVAVANDAQHPIKPALQDEATTLISNAQHDETPDASTKGADVQHDDAESPSRNQRAPLSTANRPRRGHLDAPDRGEQLDRLPPDHSMPQSPPRRPATSAVASEVSNHGQLDFLAGWNLSQPHTQVLFDIDSGDEGGGEEPQPPISSGPSAQTSATRTASTWATTTGRPDSMGPWSREAFDLFTWRPPAPDAPAATT